MRKGQDVTGVAVPSGLARGGQVIQPRQTRLPKHRRYRLRRDVGQQARACGGAELVIDHRQPVTLLRQAQHGPGEVPTARAINPTGAKNQVPTTSLRDTLLTFELGRAVHIERSGGVPLAPRRRATAIKHIVGGVMHHQRATGLGSPREHAGRLGVDTVGDFGV